MSVRVILRAAPVCTNAELDEPDAVPHFEMYRRDALRPHPGRELREIPIRIDHDKNMDPIGCVTALRTDPCLHGGTWIFAHAEIDDPPSWLRTGTPVSISRAVFNRRRPWDADWDVIGGALLSEVSLLSPGVEPEFRGAAVDWIGERIARAASNPAGQVFYGGPVIRRTFTPPKITIR